MDGLAASDGPVDHDLLDLDAALDRLAELDGRKARIVELVYFAALTQPEVAEIPDISVATVERDLPSGRAWLRAQLSARRPLELVARPPQPAARHACRRSGSMRAAVPGRGCWLRPGSSGSRDRARSACWCRVRSRHWAATRGRRR